MNNAKYWFLTGYILLFIPGVYFYFQLDHGDVVIWFNENRNGFFDFLLKYWTYLGDGLFVFLLIILMLFIKYRYAIILLVIGVCQGITTLVLKKWVFGKVPRPGKYFEGFYDLNLLEGVTMNSYYSFPSGHTLTGFSIGLFLSIISPRNFLGLIWLLYAILVGVSRIYTLQHFYRDTLVGSSIGILLTLLITFLFRNKTKAGWLDNSLRSKT